MVVTIFIFLNQARAAGTHAPDFLELLQSAKVCLCVCVCVCVCVCPPLRLLRISGVMWCDIDPIRLVK